MMIQAKKKKKKESVTLNAVLELDCRGQGYKQGTSLGGYGTNPFREDSS